MALTKTMYPGLVNSPETTTTNNIGVSDTLIYVLDPSRVPVTLPNQMTLGTGTNAETVLVTEVNGSALTVTRGFQGVAKDWPTGTIIARNFTEYDYNALKENIEELDENLGDLAGEGRTNETVKDNTDAIAAHLAENAIDAHAEIPSCKVYHDAAQSIENGVPTNLAFNSEEWDTDSIHDVAVNTNLVCKKAGKYYIHGKVIFASNANGRRQLAIKKGISSYIANTIVNAVNGAATSLEVSTIEDMEIDDYVRLEAYQNSGGALDVTADADYSPQFMMVKVG
jgi:hypothetical protein